MKPSVIFLPSRMVSLESVIWTIRAIAPSSRLRVIQSSWPSGPATNPSTVICTCSLSFRIAIKECPGGWSTYASNQLLRNRHGRTGLESAVDVEEVGAQHAAPLPGPDLAEDGDRAAPLFL